MIIKKIKSVHVPLERKGIRQGPWFEKYRYLGDRAISKLTKFNFLGVQSILRLPIDIQRDLTLHHAPGTYDDWKICVKGENHEIYLDRTMYF